MKNTTITGMFLVFLFASSIIIAGCQSAGSGGGSFGGLFGGDKRAKCSQGENCIYYSGARGVMMFIDKPPRMMYYRSSDLKSVDGNSVEINVRLKNDGASDAYGAVFLSGFSGDMFQITRIDENGQSPVVIGRNRDSCYFDIMSLGKTVGDWNFLVGCLGASYRQMGDLRKLNLGPQLFETVKKEFGWNIPLNDLDITWNDDGVLHLGIGGNAGVLNFGRSLMLIASSLNFEGLGGSSFTMKGDNSEYPGGDIDYKTFKVQMIARWPAGQDYFNLPYSIKSCYAYTTFVSPNICIDPDPFSDEQKLCYAETTAWGGTQGAPIAVTNLRQTNTGKEMIIDMTIKNVGVGRVWDVGYLEGCSPYYPGQVKPNMLNVVYIGYAKINERALDCTNNYQVRLDPNTQEARITCRYDLTEADDIGTGYIIPLKMELWYGYEETIPQQITVRRLN